VPLSTAQWNEARLHAQRRRSLEQLARQGKLLDTATGGIPLGELTQGQNPGDASSLLWDLAEHFRKQGEHELARQVLRRVAEQVQTPAAGKAWLELLAEEYSAEKRLQRQLIRAAGAPLANSRVSYNEPESERESKPASGMANTLPGTAPVRLSSKEELAMCNRIKQISTILERNHPRLFCQPLVRCQLASYWRKYEHSPEPATARLVQTEIAKLLRPLANEPDPTWRQFARAALGQTEEQNPGILCVPRAADQPMPYLDGILDDALWRTAACVEMRGGELDQLLPPTALHCAYDEQYLYLAFEVVEQAEPPKTDELQAEHDSSDDARLAQSQAKHDIPLMHAERLEFLVDTDHDLATWFRLSFTRNGFAQNELSCDPHWNPEWFLAVKANHRGWTAEVAIPLAELSESAIQKGALWRVNFMRVDPARGVQSTATRHSIVPQPQTWCTLAFE
jgi:hypothetical protein